MADADNAHAERLEDFGDRGADDTNAGDDGGLAVQRAPEPPLPDAMRSVFGLTLGVPARRHHHIDDLLAHRRPMDAAAASDQHVGLERRTAQEMIDASRQRLNPFQSLGGSDDLVRHLDTEADQHIDVGDVAERLVFAARQYELQTGKLGAQPIAIHLGMDVDDQDLGVHAGGKANRYVDQDFGRPRSRTALLQAISARTASASGT